MESIFRLREILNLVLSSNATIQYDEQELFDELMVQKPRLLGLLEIGGRNPQEKREIEAGQTTINGARVAVNAEFARQAIFLSEQLDCSERYAAEILQRVTAQNPNIDAIQTVELSVAEFHERRRALVDCVSVLIEIAETTGPASSETQQRLAEYVIQEIIHERVGPSSQPWALKVFRTVDNLDAVITTADNARRGAGSNTVAPGGQGAPALGFEIVNSRYESLKYERRNLAISLCRIARTGNFTSEEIRAILEWLPKHSNHPMTFYLLAAILAALDSADPSSNEGKKRQALATTPATIAAVKSVLLPSVSWQDSGLKATIQLKWTLCATEARHFNPNLETREGFGTEELETQIWNSVQGDAFSYLALAVLQIQGRNEGLHASLNNALSLSTEQREHRQPPSEDFKPIILSAFETLVRSLITHASSELRKIKQRQEDIVLANARSDRVKASTSRFPTTTAPSESAQRTTPRSDIPMLYTLIGLLYSSLPPERALQFWGAGPQEDAGITYAEHVETTSGRLPTFLQWAVWSTSVHDLAMLSSLYDMLSGLAKGQQCSELAYNFMARGGGEVIPGSSVSGSTSGPSVSWTAVFALLEAWATSSQTQRNQLPANQPFGLSTTLGGSTLGMQNQLVIGPKEVVLAQSFLRLLSVVVTHSTAVRAAVSGHAQFRAIPTLVSLIPLGVPLELKGAIFDTLSAFCTPGAGIPGVEICKAVWTLMERFEVINVRPSSTGFGSQAKGVEAELEEVEAVHKTYPSTISFLKLLSTLIHTPKRISLQDRLLEVQPTNTIPETLGQPYRIPGIAPFTAFIIDNVFVNISKREYSKPSDRWEINDLCLSFVERALASFDLESLLATPDGQPPKNDSLLPLVIHPGHDVMKRMLTDSDLQTNILSYLIDGVQGLEKGFALEQPIFGSMITRVLRIVSRTLELQDLFLDVFIPLLSEINNTAITGPIHPRSYFTRFDQALTYAPQYIPSIAAYVAFPGHPELVYMSIKSLGQLSLASSSNLTTLIARSNESDRIMAGFMHVLATESMDDVYEAETQVEQITGAGAPDVDDGIALTQANRLAALDLLIQETSHNRAYPNIGHFLLFGGVATTQMQDPNALGAKKTVIHVLLELVNDGVPRLKGKARGVSYATPLFTSLPGLAERCYRVIYQLCTHPRTSEFMTRYLRTREDFFARQIASIPTVTPQVTSKDPFIQAQYADGSWVTSTVESLTSFLRLRSCIFDLVALDLHALTHKGHLKGVSELLHILFGNTLGDEEDTFHEIGQSHMRIIEFLQSLSFSWYDSLTVNPMDLQFLGQMNLQSCIRRNSAGCEIVDRNALLALLTSAKRALNTQNIVVTPAHVEQLQREASYILESCVVENHRREVAHAIAAAYESWRHMLDIVLTKCFDRLPHDQRESMLFDLLHVLPSAIQSPDMADSTAVILSEVILSSVTKLREDRRQQIIAQSASGNSASSSLPAERLYAILRSILEGILDNNRVELVRGNLYASLINYVHLISSPETRIDSLSTVANVSRLSLSYDRPQENRLQTLSKSLAAGSMGVLKGVADRLVATITRDAIDGTEVWKTIAFMLLDALVQLSAGNNKHDTMLTALSRHGILPNFVRGIKESDSRLLSVLKPDPDDLNALYVYEAKMSLFVRMTETRAGAERLLDSQLVPILGQCDYLDARPEADQSFIDRDSFLPSAIQRYHQLLTPALQVVDGLLASLGNKHSSAVHQTLDFLNSHGPTLVILLKNDADEVPILLLEEIYLIVTLCTNVLSSVPKSEISSTNSGFGALHSALLNLATRCLSTDRCFRFIVPQSDTEVAQSKIRAFGYGTESVFDTIVQRKERQLRKSIIAYAGAASEFTESDITLVLSPITNPQRRDEQPMSGFLSTIPTLGDATEALATINDELAQTLQQIAYITTELGARDQIAVENIHEAITDVVDASLLQDLDVNQKRELICEELRQVRQRVIEEARILLDTAEMLLLLIWRHIQHYTSPSYTLPSAPTTSSLASSFLGRSQTTAKQGNMGINAAMRFLATPDPETFKSELGRKLGPVIGRLEELDLAILDTELTEEGAYRHTTQSQQSREYFEIMARRLRDSVGLLTENEFESGIDS